MKQIAIGLALTLAGCATPAEMIKSTEPLVAKLAQPPAAAGACITRNIERRAANIITDRRPLEGSGQELVSRVTGNVTTTYVRRLIEGC